MEKFMDNKERYDISPVGHIYTGFSSKFGIPRQSGLVKELCGEIVLDKKYCSPDFVRGLEGFSHIWAIWLFSEALGEKVNATVRPPKLGGNTRMGVFATRSPFRPNNLGLSALKLEKIETGTPRGTVLYVKGADMLSGTPIIDIKPYLPFADAVCDADIGFAPGEKAKKLEVIIPDELRKDFPNEHYRELLGILSEDPRPAYIDDDERVYSFEFYGYNIKFSVSERILNVSGICKM